MPTSPAPQAYSFGPFRIDSGERLLTRNGVVVPLTPKAVDTLIALIEAGGRLVEKDELMKRVWPDTFVEEANLSNQISLLRKAMGDDASQPRFIETIARRGYRFIAAVSAPVARPAGPEVGPASRPVTNRTLAVTLGVIALLVAVTAVVIVRNMRTDVAGVSEPLKITRLTMSGQAKHAAIAPDGRHVAYVTVGADGESLWIRQVVTQTPKTATPER